MPRFVRGAVHKSGHKAALTGRNDDGHMLNFAQACWVSPILCNSTNRSASYALRTPGPGEFVAAIDVSRPDRPTDCPMDLPDDEQSFLRDLVKASRQKIHVVKWIDRDGSDRQTVLNQAEVVRLNTIASRLKISKTEVLRQAAHIPVAK